MRTSGMRRMPSLATLAIMGVMAACGGTSGTPKGISSPAAGSVPSDVPTPTAAPVQATSSQYNQIYGVDLGIHVLSGKTGYEPVPDAEIKKLLTVLQGKVQWVRFYDVIPPTQNAPKLAHEMGFKVAASAIIQRDEAANEVALTQLVDDVNKGYVDFAIVGSEEVHINALTAPQEIAYIQDVKKRVHGKVPVGTVEPHKVLLEHPEIMRACDVVLANIAPISYAIPLPKSIDYIKTNYDKLVSLAGGVEVGIGETNWPSAGLGSSPDQEATYVKQFETWARAKNVKAFYYEAFDEPWLGQYNEQGRHWGIWTSDLKLKPGLDSVFAKT